LRWRNASRSSAAGSGIWLKIAASAARCVSICGAIIAFSAQFEPFGLLSRVLSPIVSICAKPWSGRAKGEAYQMSFRVQRSDGSLVTLYEQALPVRDEFARVVRIEGVTQDVTESRLAEQRIRFLAYHDSLTGLANRQMFREMLDHALARSMRINARCALLYVDLDRLKRINDSFGHTFGDQILREVASRLLGSVRSADFVGREGLKPDEVVARLGGDEFTVLLTDLERSEDAARVAWRICGELATADAGRTRRTGGDRLDRHRAVSRKTAAMPRHCCATPTWRCTRRSNGAAIRSSSSPKRCSNRRSSDCRWNRTWRMRWKTASSC
jgi:diguanylate cyclase (GGDEF)-like protein